MISRSDHFHQPPLRNSAADKHVPFISFFFPFFIGGTNCSSLSLSLSLFSSASHVIANILLWAALPGLAATPEDTFSSVRRVLGEAGGSRQVDNLNKTGPRRLPPAAEDLQLLESERTERPIPKPGCPLAGRRVDDITDPALEGLFTCVQGKQLERVRSEPTRKGPRLELSLVRQSSPLSTGSRFLICSSAEEIPDGDRRVSLTAA